MTECVFCSILVDELPARFAYKDDDVVAFMRPEQPTPYKVLIVPREHVEIFYDLREEQVAVIF